ncbi:hypothetical protein PTKIN_Ptkin19aG0080300 [Pterospermum kingtungense]
MSHSEKQLHIAVFPWLAFGHIVPFFQASHFLAQRGHHIYYISTPRNISRLPKLPPQISSNVTLMSLPLPHVDGLPAGVESPSEIPIHKIPYLKQAYDKLEHRVTEFLKSSSQVKWIIHDFCSHWLPPVATQLGINLVFFSIFCASSIAFLGPPSELLGGGRSRPEDFTTVPEWMDYPNNIAFKLHEISRHQECMDTVSDFERLGTLLLNCKILTVRTCFEVEPDALRVISKIHQKPVFPLGLLPPSMPSNELDKNDQTWEALKKWLDSKEEKSVFYVALGSEVNLSLKFMHELAFGIEKSGLPFLWAIRNRPVVEEESVQDIIPTGFEERVSDRGLVLRGWAPQLRVLAHSSVGGYLSHGGWSSTIESLGLGVPLILFPVECNDLGLLTRMLHGRKLGLEIERNEVDGSFTSDSVAASIRHVMVDSEGEQLRINAYAMKGIFGNVDLSNKYLDEFSRFIEEFPASSDEV